MFHHTHAYLASELYKSEDKLLLVGSILPDLAITGIISWDDGLHGAENNFKFQNFISEKYPRYKSLSEGVNAHNIVDDYSHLEYRGKLGYAFQNNQELTKLVAEFYELDEEKAQGKAHNYIESGVDILFLKENPGFQVILKEAIKEISKEKLAEILSVYFHKDKAVFLKSLNDYFDQFTKYDFAEKENWNLFWADLERLLKLKNIGPGKREQLLNKSLQVTKPTHKDFLEYIKKAGIQKT